MDNISRWYEGKSLIIFGVTGFVGKVLLEILLRNCSGLRKIYVVIRSKKYQNSHERFIQLTKHSIFQTIRESNPKLWEKVQVVSGDVSIENLGFSETDRTEIIKHVNIIYHSAASLRFNDKLKTALNTNTIGTLRVLKLAEEMTNLKAFCYVSTAFVHCFRAELDERYYPSHLNVHAIIESSQTFNSDEMDDLEHRLLAMGFPNTYIISKCLSEDLLASYHHTIPIIIVRPSMITASFGNPYKGYVEGLGTGLVGCVMGVMSGLLRTMYVDENVSIKLTPIDFVVNSVIVAACKRSLTRSTDMHVYNCSDDETKQVTWKAGLKMLLKSIYELPVSDKLVWYPRISLTKCLVWHKISLYLFQLLPAMFFDLLIMLKGKKPMLTITQWKIINSIGILHFFTSKNFFFKTDKLRQLNQELSASDKNKFNFDHSKTDWEEAERIAVRGIRKYIFGEDDSTLEQAKRKLKIMNMLDKAWMILIMVVFIYFVKRSVY